MSFFSNVFSLYNHSYTGTVFAVKNSKKALSAGLQDLLYIRSYKLESHLIHSAVDDNICQ